MKKILLPIFVLLLLPAFSKAEAIDISGVYWNKEKDAQISIYPKEDGKFYGSIVWNKTPKKRDVNNPDPNLRDRPVRGLEILSGFEYNPKNGKWINGKIYDPKKGKTYKCKMWFKDGKSNVLNIRGYMGISLIGRTSQFYKIK